MTSTAITQDTGITIEALESILVDGNLDKLTPAQRLDYYAATCKSLGLNPLTKPFSYIRIDGKTTLYPLKETTDQLRKLNSISVRITAREMFEESYVVTAVATLGDGRTDESTGAVCMTGLRGADHSNALMKAETKAKRRVTLSISGLGMLDESEIDSIAGAIVNNVDVDTGEFIEGTPTTTPVRKAPQQPAPATQQGETKRFEYCPEHNTQWTQSDKQIKLGYAPSHAIKDGSGTALTDPTGRPLWCNMDDWVGRLGERATAIGFNPDETKRYMDADIGDKFDMVMYAETLMDAANIDDDEQQGMGI